MLGVALLAALPVQAETLVIAGDDWCPVNCQAGSDKPGIFVELAQQIFQQAGIDVQYQMVNWARAVHDTRNGRFNAVIGAGRNDAPDFVFTDSAPGISRMCFYTRPDTGWRYQGVSSLAAVRLGTINGYSYGERLDAYIAREAGVGQRVQQVTGDHALSLNVKKLLAGRVDATVENAWVMAAYLAGSGLEGQLLEVGCRSPDVPIYLAFSPALPSSAHYAEIFQAGLREYRDNGKLQALLARYGVPL